MMKASTSGLDGLCTFCRGQLNSGGSKAGGAMLTTGASQLVAVCETCANDGTVLRLVADAVADCALDAGTIAAEFAALLGLPE